ncbi:restriction endonuclease subunit S [Alkalibacterium thalassium]|nr:restriction endonuclease subunit S [Alkalibacterium thalassium]
MSKNNVKPEIRFKNFTDAWEQRKWYDTVNISTDMVDPKEGKYDDLPHIGPGNIESFTGRILNNVKTVREDNLISGKFHFNSGDIIYGKINPQLAKYAYVNFEGLTSADTYVLNSHNGIDQYFLFVILQTKDFYKYSVSVSMRTGMPKINRDELNQYNYLAPSNIDEQRKIGTFFKQLDDTIALHQHELTLLKQRKKAFLQKMFPNKEESVPELRFNGFSDDWEEVNLLDCVGVYQPSNLPQSDFTETGYPVYGANGLIGYYSEYNHVEPQIAVACRGNTCGTVNLIPEMSWITSNAMVVNTYENTDLDFNYMLQLMTAFNFDPYIAGSGQPQLTRSSLAGLKIQLPSLEEQQHIGQFFKTLDDTIEQHKQKAEAYKEMKQAFLQKMFV